MGKNEQDALDVYRQERKERIAKQSKKAEKKSNSHQGAKNVIGRVLSAVIAVVVVVAILGASLNFFGAPQKILKAVTIDGKSYSMSELSCYYMMAYNNVVNYASTYDSTYGDGYGKMLTGYDTSLSPSAQTTTNDDGDEVTWDEYFLEEAIESMASIKRYYQAAVDAGIELSEEEEQEIQDTIASYETYIGNYSLSRYLSLVYGKGVSAKLFKKILTEQKLVELYQEQRQEALKADYSSDDVEAVYNEDKTAYDVVTVRWYTINVESETAAAETVNGEEESSAAENTEPLAEEVKAQEFIAKVQSQQNYNEETFKDTVLEFVDPDDENYETYKQDAATLLQKIGKSAVETNVSKDAAEWLYEQDDDGNYVRQAGDMNYFLNSDGNVVYIFYATGVPFQDETVPASVRHILIQYPTEEASEDVSGEAETEETTVSAEVKSECQSEAESILAVYKNHIEDESEVSDEDYFGELASQYSGDTGSQSNGGLISDMKNDGSYVTAFEDWVFAEGDYAGETRNEGDTAIVESEYGYHIMYYVGGHEYPSWYETILNTLIEEDWESEQTAFEESFGEDAIVRKEKIVNSVRKSCVKSIESRL